MSNANKRKIDPDRIEMEILSYLKQTNKSEAVDALDEELIFTKAIALTLKRFDSRQKAIAKIKIQQLLFDIEFQQPAHQQAGSFPPVNIVGHNQHAGFNDSFSSSSEYSVDAQSYFQYSRRDIGNN